MLRKEVVSFVKRQLTNSRNATKVKDESSWVKIHNISKNVKLTLNKNGNPRKSGVKNWINGSA